MWKWVKRVMIVLLLLLSSGIAVLWVRSYFVTHTLSREWGQVGELRVRGVNTGYGGVVVREERLCIGSVDLSGHTRSEVKTSASLEPEYPYRKRNPGDERHWRCVGFQFVRGTKHFGSLGTHKYVIVVVPFWFLLLVTGMGPAIARVRYVRRRRREGRRGFPVEVREVGTGGEGGPQKSG